MGYPNYDPHGNDGYGQPAADPYGADSYGRPGQYGYPDGYSPIHGMTGPQNPDPVPGHHHPQQYGPGPRDTRDQTLALVAHLGGLLTSFIVPLVLYLVKKDESPFVRHHAAEALNFQITVFIALMACLVLTFVFVGLPLYPVVVIGNVILSTMAAVASNNGAWYRYPISIRMVT